MSLSSLLKHCKKVYKRVDKLDTRLFELEDELDDPDETLDYYVDDNEYIRFQETGVLYGNFLESFFKFINENDDIVISDDIVQHMISDIESIENSVYEWTGTLDPSNQEDSLHHNVSNSLRLLHDIQFVLKKMQKQTKDKKKMRNKSKLSLSKILSGPLIDSNKELREVDIDEGILEKIASAMDKIKVEDTTLHKFKKGRMKKGKKTTNKDRKIKGNEGIKGIEGKHFKTFKITDKPSSCRRQVEEQSCQGQYCNSCCKDKNCKAQHCKAKQCKAQHCKCKQHKKTKRKYKPVEIEGSPCVDKQCYESVVKFIDL